MANSIGFLTLKDILDLKPEPNAKPIIEIPNDENKNLKDYFKFEEDVNNPIAIDLRLGDEVFISTKEVPFNLGNSSEPNEFASIKPGEFALLTTYEKLNLPDDILGLISMKFSLKLKGLINVSGFHVDPGYSGRIIYSVYNAGPTPIVVRRKEKVFTILLSRINTRSYRKEATFQNIDHLQEKHIAGLLGTPISLHSIYDKVRVLEMWNKITLGIMSGLVITVISVLLGKGG